MKVLVSSPFPLDGESGNAVTARRIAGLLPEAKACHGWDGQSADLLITLHAHRSRSVVERFQAVHPKGRVAILLTGTDLNDFPADELVEIGKKVDALVGMHDLALQRLPEQLRDRAHVIFPSVDVPRLQAQPEPGLVSLIGHLRQVKNPFLAVGSLGDLPCRLVHIGQALSDEQRREAERWESDEPRYEWLGRLSRAETLKWLVRSCVTLNTSHSEGASNVVAEAIVLGVPVLATRIDGNVGLLGSDYAGLFEPARFEEYLCRVLQDGDFKSKMMDQLDVRRPLFSAKREACSWASLVKQLFKFS